MNSSRGYIALFRCLFLLAALVVSSIGVAQVVYTTRTGEKYHLDGCRYLSRSKIETTIAEAEQRGYTPCSVCKPRKANAASNTTTTNTLNRSAVSRQCSARTKSGARCSRMTKESNGRCWQHQ